MASKSRGDAYEAVLMIGVSRLGTCPASQPGTLQVPGFPLTRIKPSAQAHREGKRSSAPSQNTNTNTNTNANTYKITLSHLQYCAYTCYKLQLRKTLSFCSRSTVCLTNVATAAGAQPPPPPPGPPGRDPPPDKVANLIFNSFHAHMSALTSLAVVDDEMRLLSILSLNAVDFPDADLVLAELDVCIRSRCWAWRESTQ
ncbi:hypothetical protein EJ04DRAFT_522298 [Polyplosphaeria fusca]|uniref:Uncharacterized protein n=1 Tax=Polyplosphaeria fusca TaxID=682080 RepID=A0A9P4V554_9PLEO|nr:hypothetical protein EJ04DRAFT_522298 [Polyplosphaeria fusca]